MTKFRASIRCRNGGPLVWLAGAGLLLAACGGRSGTSPTGPPPATTDQPPSFETLELLYREASGFAVLTARASDPDGTPTAIECGGDVEAAGTGTVQDSVAIARGAEDRLLAVTCVATSNGLHTEESASATVPAREAVPTFTWSFTVYEMTDHGQRLDAGRVRVRASGRDTTVAAKNGVYRLALPRPSGSLAPATATVEVRYDDASHTGPLQVLRQAPDPGTTYGSRLGASWSQPFVAAELPEDDGGFEIFAAPDDFDRDRYFRLAARGDVGAPNSTVCENADPSGTADGALTVSFHFDESTGGIADAIQDVVRQVFAGALPAELSGGIRYDLDGSEVSSPPDRPFLLVEPGLVASPGQVATTTDATGCVERAALTVPYEIAGAPPPDLSPREGRRLIAKALFFPAAGDADVAALLRTDGTFDTFAASAIAAGVAIGPDPGFFQR